MFFEGHSLNLGGEIFTPEIWGVWVFRVWVCLVTERAFLWQECLDVVWALFSRHLGLWSPWCRENGQAVTSLGNTRMFPRNEIANGEVRVYKSTGVSRGVRQTTWERSLKKWELQIPSFKEFSGRGTLWDSSLPVTLALWDTPVLCTPPLPLSQRKPERGYIRMFPRNENRNEGAFACSPGTKTGTRVHRQNHILSNTDLLTVCKLGAL